MLEPYVEHLLELAFVEQVQARSTSDAATVLELQTPKGKRRLVADVKTTNLSYAIAAETIAFMRLRGAGKQRSAWILLAPQIGAGMGAYLREHDVNYLDQAGNCYLRLDDQYIAHIEGRRLPKPAPGRRGVGAAGYRVLFALLASPALLPMPVRRIAEHAGVNRQTVAQMIDRLVADGLVVRGRRPMWIEGTRRKALEQWLAGYEATVRPKLWLGAFRTGDKTPAALRERIEPVLDAMQFDWRRGGEWGGHLLNGYYEGERTVIHIDEDRLPLDFAQQLRAAPANDGRLIVLGMPGPEALETPHPATVHPLLVWSELMASGDERAREAASQPLRVASADGIAMTEYALELAP